MGVVQNIIGMVRDIHAQQKSHQVDEQLKNYLTNPDAAIAAVNQIDPRSGMALNQAHIGEVAARDAAARAAGTADLGVVRNALRGMPAGTDLGAAFDQMSPAFAAMGAHPERLASFKAAIAANPNILMDDKAYEDWSKDQHTNTVAPIGSHVIRGGQVIDKVPFAARTVTTPAGATSTIFNPNANDGTGSFVTGSGGGGAVGGGVTGGPLTVERLRPLLVTQESHGDYTAKNTETGALGRYQIMPATGRTLAQRAGLPWRPDMMVKDDQASRNYQDKLGDAAIQDSIDAGGGDASKTFSHYYSGSPTAYLNAKGNPKTARYTTEMNGRLANDGGAAIAPPPGGANITPTSVSVPAKPDKAPITVRQATAVELNGYPEGTAAQIDSNGKLVNIRTPKAPSAANLKNAPSFDKYKEAATGLDELEHNIMLLRNDPGLGTATGMMGSVMNLIPGTHRHYLSGLKDQINSQKMIGLLSSLQATGGNPFQRVTNMEASTLPKTLGNFELNQSRDDLIKNADRALAQVREMKQRVRESATHAGIIGPNGERVEHAQPSAAAAPAPTRARDHSGVLHELTPGKDPANPANWRVVS